MPLTISQRRRRKFTPAFYASALPMSFSVQVPVWAMLPHPLSLAPGAVLPLHEAQAAAGLQPAGRRLPPLVPEYKQIVVVRSAAPLFAGVRKLENATALPPEASSTHDAIDSACCVPWFERVNTASNIADDPSRGAGDESLGRRFETDALSIAQSALVPWG